MTSIEHLKLLLPYYVQEYRNIISPDLAEEIIKQPDLKFFPATAGGGKTSEARRCYVKAIEPKFNKKISSVVENARPGDQKVYISDVRKAEQYLGWTPITNVESGVETLSKWAEENRHLFRQAGVI